jgi:hypothetical protein
MSAQGKFKEIKNQPGFGASKEKMAQQNSLQVAF